ncbi:MAG TPA: sigma-70 family RNA polymerase sigma factor [Bdellovibrio sp.]|uniref:sigma-70 family RNA polymerase sigma factor n=1 Tax=Bdellovibrio sp. TaxID=28201 RepID=UPI002F10FE97
MSGNDWLVKKFEESRSRLEGVAFRLLGSKGEADDAVQEAWIRVNRADTQNIDNLGGWLTTVVARICLDMLRTRKVRKEEPIPEKYDEAFATESPEEEILLANSMGPALLIILETLTPPERVSFVLHDLFDIEFEEIANILDRSEVATRQLASRARVKIRGAKKESKQEMDQHIVSAFLAASRSGNLEGLLQLLDPNIVLRADPVAVQIATANKDRGAPQFEKEMRGNAAIADVFKGRATAAQLAFINGQPGATWIADERPRVVFTFTIANGKISEIGVIMNQADLDDIEVVLPA